MPSNTARDGRPGPAGGRRLSHIPWLIGIVGLLVSTLGFVHLQERVSSESEVRLAREASNLSGLVNARLSAVLEGLMATQAFIENSYAIEDGEFAGFVAKVFDDENSMLRVAWLRDAEGARQASFAFAQAAASHPIPLAAELAGVVQEARLGKTAVRVGVTPRVIGLEGEPLMVLAVPVSGRSGAGVLLGFLQPEKLVTVNWAASESGILLFNMRPSRAPDGAPHVTFKAAPSSFEENDVVEIVRTFQFAGQEWQSRFFAVPVAGRAMLGFSPILLLMSGLMLTATIAGHLWSSQRRAVEIAGLVDMLRRTNVELTDRVRERDEIGDTLRASEWKYREVVDGVSDVIFECDDSGRLSLLNAAWRQITGFEVAESQTVSLFDFVHQDDRHTLRSYFKSFVTSDASPTVAELRLRTRRQTFRIVEIAARRLQDPQGEAGQIVGMIKDVTERREAEAALRAAEQRYRAIVENALDGIFQSSPEGRFLSANPALAKMLGYATPDELIASIEDVGTQVYVDPDQHRSFTAQMDSAAVSGRELEFYRKDHSVIWVAISARAVRDEAGTVVRYEGTIKEVTERKHAETALRLAKEQADMASRTKSEFLANMSHELRTPLNAIIGFSEIIKDQMFGKIDRPDYVEYARDIFESGKHLLELINDILDMSKIEAGKRELNETAIDLNRVVMACLRLIRPRAETAALTVVTDLPNGLNYLRAEELALKQIFLNLLSNAVKFTPERGEVRLTARVEADGAMLITVSDTGIGIARQDMAKALSPFGQIDSALSRKASGTGLGLTLVQSLVALHDGRFHLESEVGKGTTAYVWLPASRVLREVA